MYILKNKKGKVNSYKLINEHLLEVKNGNLFFDDDLVDNEVDTYNYSLVKNKIIYLKEEQTRWRGSVINKSIIADSICNGKALFISEFNVEQLTLRYEFVNIEDGSTICDLGNRPVLMSTLVHKNTVLLNFGKEVCCFDLENGVKEDWTWKRGMNIKKILGLFKNEVLLACDKHSVVSISRNTGIVSHQYQELSGFKLTKEYDNVIPNSSSFVLDSERAKLTGLFHTYLIEISLNNREIDFFNLSEKLSRYRINSFKRFGDNAITNNHIFAIAYTDDEIKENVEYDTLIALNRVTHDIDWQYHFRGAGVGTNKPKIQRDKLYQRDVNGELYFFSLLKSS